MHRTILLLLLALFTSACKSRAPSSGANVATFAGGCFWCLEASFEQLDGVTDVVSGYTGGHVIDPTDEQVSDGDSGHAEAILIHFDGSRTSYDALLDLFWRQIDPTDAGGQFDDRGDEYRTVIYFHDAGQEQAARASKAALEQSAVFDGEIVTDIEPAAPFYPAADRHQNFCTRNPERFEASHAASGRDAYFKSVWDMEPRQ